MPIGKIDAFDQANEDWSTCVERVEQFFIANAMDEDKQVPAILSLMGTKTYSLLRSLCAPDKPASKPLKEIVEILQHHLSPKPQVIAERFRFHKRNQLEAGISVAIIVVIVISITVLLLCFVFGVVYYRRRKPRDLPPDIDSVTHGENVYAVSCLPLDNLDSSSKQECFSWSEISRDCLVMGDVLGEGEFGLVVKAILLDEQSNCDFPVAVKTVKDMATETDRGELLKELRLMANVEEHPNVVNLIGACSMEGPLLVIVEFCEFGSLLSYLRENRKELPGKGGAFVTSLDPLTRVRFAYDVAKGMCHLERKRIVHRDLAARNVLLGKNKIAKVSDFGLSRDTYEAGLYEKATGGRLPVKWMAIESLQEAKYTSKSDVWSFGVLFWEIETADMIPYPGLSGIELLEYLQDGNRLPKPAETLSEMYEVMLGTQSSSKTSFPKHSLYSRKVHGTTIGLRANFS